MILVEPGLQKREQPGVGSGVLILCLNQNWFQREILVLWKTVPPCMWKNSSWNSSKMNNMANSALISWTPCWLSLQSHTLCWDAPHLCWGVSLFQNFCFSWVCPFLMSLNQFCLSIYCKIVLTAGLHNDHHLLLAYLTPSKFPEDLSERSCCD